MNATSLIRQLHDAGVSVWLDDLSRPLLDGGVLQRYVAEHALSGVTCNPTIFAAALRGGDGYDEAIAELVAGGITDPRELYFSLALTDVRDAASLLRDTYDSSLGRDGYVSFECTPDVAHDAGATVRQAREVWSRLDTPNLMIKVPATDAGIVALEQLTAAGINVNVTLLFGVGRYEQAARAYQRGLERRVQEGEPIDHVRSVASVFVSRIDASVEKLIGADALAPGAAGIANAQTVYERALQLHRSPAWQSLRERGAHWQRPLWASTAPKSDRLGDVTYVEALALPDTIITVPEKTLLAFADHGRPRLVASDPRGAREVLRALADRGVDLEIVGGELERAGVTAFGESYAEVLERLRASDVAALRGQAVDLAGQQS